VCADMSMCVGLYVFALYIHKYMCVCQWMCTACAKMCVLYMYIYVSAILYFVATYVAE